MNQKGICRLSVVPVRGEASDKAEMTTQLLFGDHYEVLELSENKKWMKVRIDFDQYEGWIDSKQFFEAQTPEKEDEQYIFTELMYTLVMPFGPVNVLMGSVLDNNDETVGEQMQELFDENAVKRVSEKRSAVFLEERALQYLNAPYLWGGKTVFGIDCSGFTQQVFKMCGFKLPRDAYQQAEIGDKVEDTSTVKGGDLAFFHNDQGKITHVGILLSENEIIHASGHVRIDRFDAKGIFNEEIEEYSHTLTFVKRIFG